MSSCYPASVQTVGNAMSPCATASFDSRLSLLAKCFGVSAIAPAEALAATSYDGSRTEGVRLSLTGFSHSQVVNRHGFSPVTASERDRQVDELRDLVRFKELRCFKLDEGSHFRRSLPQRRTEEAKKPQLTLRGLSHSGRSSRSPLGEAPRQAPLFCRMGVLLMVALASGALADSTIESSTVANRSASGGTEGLLITVAPCTGDTVTGTVTTSTLVEVCDLIVADATVQAPAALTLRSGTGVELEAGFEVAVGASLEVEVTPALGGVAYVQDNTPAAEWVYHARFYIRMNLFTMSSDEVTIFRGLDAAGVEVFRVFVDDSSGNRIAIEAREDDGSNRTSSFASLPIGWQVIEIEWKVPKTPVQEDGVIRLFRDDSVVAEFTDLDNDSFRIESVQLGAVDLFDGTASGEIWIDDFVSRNDGHIGPTP